MRKEQEKKLESTLQTQELIDAEVAKLTEKLHTFNAKEATLKEKSEFYRYSILPYLDLADSGTQGLLINEINRKLAIPKRAISKDLKNKSLLDSHGSLGSLRSPGSLILPGLIEIVQTSEGLRFWFQDGLKSSTAIDGVTYSVPSKINLISLPSDNALVFMEEDDGPLFDDIQGFIYDHVELPHDTGYGILAMWVLHSWLTDRVNYSPIINLYGPKGTGKSTVGDVLASIARRSISTVSLTGPAIFRVSELYSPTFIIDEVRLTGRWGNKDILSLLNCRFQRGRKVIRINTDKDGMDSIETFDVFGTTILCGTEEIPETVRSRTIRFVMEANLRSVNRRLDTNRASILRDRLAAFRFRHIKTDLPDPKCIVKNGRLDDVIYPLHQMTLLVKPGFEEGFFKFMRSVEKDRIEEEYSAIDVEIIMALKSCINEGKIHSGKILVADVTTEVNRTREENEKLPSRVVGNLLTRLGFKPTCTTSGAKARFWDSQRFKRLCQRYAIHDDESDPSDPSDPLYPISDNLKSNGNTLTIPLK